MTSRAQPPSAARHALRVGSLVVVLAGLFGMHGLAGHGAAGLDLVPDTVMTAAAMSTGAAGHEAVSTPGRGAMDMVMAGTCMAILALALITLLRLLHTDKTRSVLWRVARRGHAPAPTSRDPDPPSLIDLSTRRC